MDFKKIIAYLDSEDGKASMDSFFVKLKQEEEVKASQIARFHARYGNNEGFAGIVEKIRAKYNSEAYKDRHYLKLRCMPMEDLYWFLLEYATIHGRLCTEAESDMLDIDYPSSAYFIHGYYIGRMDGQGSYVWIVKA